MGRTTMTGKPPAGELLLKNMRLLDLDEEFDWPGLDGTTFAAASGADAQAERVQAALWVLFRLFDRWDAAWTAAALAPYFPPLEPRQAAELKLLLYKRLAELKQEGRLGRDVTLRRSMLDDCKGPRFEELLALFSALVLQQRGFGALHSATTDISAAGSATTNPAATDPSVVAQLCAGTASLSKEHRAALILAYRSSCAGVLRQRSASETRFRALRRELQARRGELDERAAALDAAPTEPRVPQRTLDRLERAVTTSWRGDAEWADIVLRGDRVRHRNDFLQRSFSDIWAHATADRLYAVRPEHNPSLLDRLGTRVAQQNARLQHWRAVRDRVIVQSEAMAAADHAADHAADEAVSADEPIDSTSAEPVSPALQSDARPTRSVADAQSMPPPRRPAEPSRASAKASARPQSSHASPPQTRARVRSAAPRPPSPPSPSPAAPPAPAALPSPAPADPQALQAAQIVSSVLHAAPTPRRPPAVSLSERTRMSLANLPAASTPAAPPPVPRVPDRLTSSTAADYSSADAFAENAAADAPASAATPATPERPLASLAERARQSMALASSSAAGKGAAHELRRKSRMARMSNAFPVNQFETPRRPAGLGFDESLMADSLLDERLEDLVDEEAAFQSRPRVAATPPPPGMREWRDSALSVREATGQLD